MNVAARFEQLVKQIADWPAAERAARIEKAALAFAQVVDLQAQQLAASPKRNSGPIAPHKG
jgi:hypothetical protein